MNNLFNIHCCVSWSLKSLLLRHSSERSLSLLTFAFPSTQMKKWEEETNTVFLCGFASILWFLNDFCLTYCHAQTACLVSVRLLISSPSAISCPCTACTNSNKSSKTWWCRVSFCPPNLQVLRRRGETDAPLAPQVWPGETTSPRKPSVGSWVAFPPSALPINLPNRWSIGQKFPSLDPNVYIQYQYGIERVVFRHLEPSQQYDPDVLQQYVDYMILDPSRSSVRMQAPLLEPSTYRQVGGLPVSWVLERLDTRKEIRNLRLRPGAKSAPLRVLVCEYIWIL